MDGVVFMKDIPYSTLQEDERAYQILQLHDQKGCSFAEIAARYGLSASRIRAIYSRIKHKQAYLYIRQIAFSLGHPNTEAVQKIFHDAEKSYQDISYACAYLEKKYGEILTEYRKGEPGTRGEVICNLPAFRPKLPAKTVERVVAMREREKATFRAIARELRITPEKARHTYEMFYHKEVFRLIGVLQAGTDSPAEKQAIWEGCLNNNQSPKKRYDWLIQKMDSMSESAGEEGRKKKSEF